MSNFKSYFKNDFYLIIFYIITVILAIQWQDHMPYDSSQREMSIIEDFFICALLAFPSLSISLVGLSEFKSQKNEEAIYISKLVLGCIYGTLCTVVMVYIADTSILRHEAIWRVIITTILFYTAVYFSILYYVKLKTGKYMLITFLASLPYIYLLFS